MNNMEKWQEFANKAECFVYFVNNYYLLYICKAIKAK